MTPELAANPDKFGSFPIPAERTVVMVIDQKAVIGVRTITGPPAFAATTLDSLLVDPTVLSVHITFQEVAR